MKRLKLLKGVLKRTHADRLIAGFILFFLLDAFLIMLIEPGITNYRDAVWYCYAVFSTAGFGDFTAVTILGRALSILLTVYTILIVAIVTGVVVAFYNDVVAMKYKASKAEILDKLENLDKLSKDELKELSERINKII
ncbi:MAG: potassium channel family protein [Lachnospiraceae bacterium]|nr:potassium channel family protein [Lachnospiraceae bacterium]